MTEHTELMAQAEAALEGVTEDEPEAGEGRAVIVIAKWKPCFHGGGWWVARDADGRSVSIAPDGFAPAILAVLRAETAAREAAEARVNDLSDMLIIAERDGWEKAMTGRDIVFRSARATLAKITGDSHE